MWDYFLYCEACILLLRKSKKNQEIKNGYWFDLFLHADLKFRTVGNHKLWFFLIGFVVSLSFPENTLSLVESNTFFVIPAQRWEIELSVVLYT